MRSDCAVISSKRANESVIRLPSLFIFLISMPYGYITGMWVRPRQRPGGQGSARAGRQKVHLSFPKASTFFESSKHRIKFFEFFLDVT